MKNEPLRTRQEIVTDRNHTMPKMILQNSDRPEGITQKHRTPAMAALIRKYHGANRRCVAGLIDEFAICLKWPNWFLSVAFDG